MSVDQKIALVNRAPTQEVLTGDDLRALFERERSPKHYIGFEISGKLHLGFLAGALKINDFAAAGAKTTVFLADWHSLINHKLGGDWEKIQAASDYFAEAFKRLCPKTSVVKGSDVYHHNDAYWKRVVQFAGHNTLARTLRTVTIMGRSEHDALDAAQLLYPAMQAVDIHELDVSLAHSGMDQRKIHALARDVFPKMGWQPPVCVHHELLHALSAPEPNADGGKTAAAGEKSAGGRAESGKGARVAAVKMSKSKPDSAIFIHDSPAEIQRKIAKAYCPETIEGNPVLQYLRVLWFRGEKRALNIERNAKFGGDVAFQTYGELEKAYAAKTLHAADLKAAAAKAVNALVAPVRTHFEKHAGLLRVFESAEITR